MSDQVRRKPCAVGGTSAARYWLFLRTAHRAPRSMAVAGLLLLSSCTTLDRAVGAVPWFTTMRDQIAVRPFERLPGDTSRAPWLLPPEGSVPTTGREDSLDIYSPAGLRIVDALRNPVTRDDASLSRGGRIFTTYCAVCHGPQGQGDGPVAGRFGYVPNLTQDMTKARSDGYIYAIIRHGRGLMPHYGDKIRNVHDRWNVVNYVRSLQGASSLTPAPVERPRR